MTNPEIIKSWVWDEVKAVYIDDKLNIELDQFLEQGHNVHVKSNMLALMLVAAQKDFWQADEDTLRQLAKQFTDLILENGLPGSGHTSQDHPMYQWLESYVDKQKYEQLQQLLTATKVTKDTSESPSVVAEISMSASEVNEQPTENETSQDVKNSTNDQYWLIGIFLLLIIVGVFQGTRPPKTI